MRTREPRSPPRESRLSVTHLTLLAEGVSHFYNRQGTADQRIKGDEPALKWRRLPLLPDRMKSCVR